MFPEFNVDMVFGGVLIAIFAWERFNTPPTIRASTTAYRYHSAALVYLMVYLVTFAIFTRYPHLVSYLSVDSDLVEGSGMDPRGSVTVFVAVLLSLLVPKVPLISHLDERLRHFLQRLASIPYEALRLSREIQGLGYGVPAGAEDAVREELRLQGLGEDAVRLDTDDAATAAWIRTVSLMHLLKHWEQKGPFAVFVQERGGQYRRLHRGYRRIAQMAESSFALNKKAAAEPDVQAVREAAGRFRVSLVSEEREFFQEICDFISHGVLKCRITAAAREKELEAMGFQRGLEPRRRGLSVNHAAALFLSLLMLVLTNFILFQPENTRLEPLLLKIAMIVAIYSAAVVCAVFPKQRWRLFRPGPEGGYPWAGYLVSGLVAVMASMGIALFFKSLVFLQHPDIGIAAAIVQGWGHFATNAYPWLSMSFVTAIATALAVDLRLPMRLHPYADRAIRGALLAGVLMVAAGFVRMWLADLSASGAFSGTVPDLAGVLRLTALVGFVIGFVVPAWFRTGPRRQAPDAAARGPRIQSPGGGEAEPAAEGRGRQGVGALRRLHRVS